MKFEIGNQVELLSYSFEDGGHFSGDTGIVVDVQTDEYEQDIRVEWDNGAGECWIPAEDFQLYNQ